MLVVCMKGGGKRLEQSDHVHGCKNEVIGDGYEDKKLNALLKSDFSCNRKMCC